MPAYNNIKSSTKKASTPTGKKTTKKRVSKKIVTRPGRRTGFSPKEFKKTGDLHPMARIRAKRKTATINGQRFAADIKNPIYMINKGTAILKRRGYAQFPQIVGDELSAENFLFNIGCTVSNEGVEFTLADPAYDPNLDQDEIENPNILDIPSFQKITNRNILATDKFSLVNDPFFRLDGDEYGGIPKTLIDQRRTLLKAGRGKSSGLIQMAASYAILNTDSGARSGILKDFKRVTHQI